MMQGMAVQAALPSATQHRVDHEHRFRRLERVPGRRPSRHGPSGSLVRESDHQAIPQGQVVSRTSGSQRLLPRQRPADFPTTAEAEEAEGVGVARDALDENVVVLACLKVGPARPGLADDALATGGITELSYRVIPGSGGFEAQALVRSAVAEIDTVVRASRVVADQTGLSVVDAAVRGRGCHLPRPVHQYAARRRRQCGGPGQSAERADRHPHLRPGGSRTQREEVHEDRLARA